MSECVLGRIEDTILHQRSLQVFLSFSIGPGGCDYHDVLSVFLLTGRSL